MIINKKYHVLLIYPSLKIGGAQKYTFHLAHKLKSRGIEVLVLCDRINKYDEDSIYYHKFVNSNIEILPILNFFNLKSWLVRKKINKWLVRILNKLNRQLNFLVLYVLKNSVGYIVLIDYSTYNMLYSSFSRMENFEIHFLCNMHQDPENYFLKFKKERKYTITFFNKDQLNSLRLFFVNPETRFYHIPLLYDYDFSFEQKKYLKLKADIDKSNYEVNIGVVTRIHENKRIEGLLFAFQCLLKKLKNKNINLIIAGKVESIYYKIYLEKLIYFYDIKNVKFVVEGGSIIDIVDKCNIHFGWCLGVGGTVGYAGIDMVMVGIPVIAFDITGHENKTPDNFISVVSADDLATCTIDFLLNIELYECYLNNLKKIVANVKNQEKAIDELVCRIKTYTFDNLVEKE